MTEITCTSATEYTVDIVGHAKGSVETCAGISAICYMLYGYIESESDICVTRAVLQSGEAHISFKGGKKAKHAYDMAVTGLRQIAYSMPNYAKIRIF